MSCHTSISIYLIKVAHAWDSHREGICRHIYFILLYFWALTLFFCIIWLQFYVYAVLQSGNRLLHPVCEVKEFLYVELFWLGATIVSICTRAYRKHITIFLETFLRYWDNMARESIIMAWKFNFLHWILGWNFGVNNARMTFCVKLRSRIWLGEQPLLVQKIFFFFWCLYWEV